MPITINDCKRCGHSPNFDHDIEDGVARIIVYCVNGHWQEIHAGTIANALRDWNDSNPPKEGEETDENID